MKNYLRLRISWRGWQGSRRLLHQSTGSENKRPEILFYSRKDPFLHFIRQGALKDPQKGINFHSLFFFKAALISYAYLPAQGESDLRVFRRSWPGKNATKHKDFRGRKKLDWGKSYHRTMACNLKRWNSQRRSRGKGGSGTVSRTPPPSRLGNGKGAILTGKLFLKVFQRSTQRFCYSLESYPWSKERLQSSDWHDPCPRAALRAPNEFLRNLPGTYGLSRGFRQFLNGRMYLGSVCRGSHAVKVEREPQGDGHWAQRVSRFILRFPRGACEDFEAILTKKNGSHEPVKRSTSPGEPSRESTG